MVFSIVNIVDPSLPFSQIERRFRDNGATDEEISYARRQHATGRGFTFTTMKFYGIVR